MVNGKPLTRNEQPIFYALRITLYAFNSQLATHNSQPNFGANAPPTCQFHALRITLYAFNPQLTTRNPQPSTRFRG